MSYGSEDRADWEQLADNERRRYEEEHPLWDKCRNHQTRAAIPFCYDRQLCAECIADRAAMRADFRPLDAWRGDDRNDMQYHSDHSRYQYESKGLK